MVQRGTVNERLALLFAPGERLGWIFRDRWQFVRPFPEPPPARRETPRKLVQRRDHAKGRLGLRLGRVAQFGLVSALSAAAVGFGARGLSAALSTLMYLVAGVCAATTVAALLAVSAHYRGTGAAVRRADERAERALERDTADWEQRRVAFDLAERARVDDLPEWGAARTPEGTRRVDVVGGTLWGWKALLTVFGTSMLGTRGPLTVLDLSGESVCAELVRVAAAAGAGVDLQRLPTDLPDSDLLVGLDRRQVVDALVESMHGDGSGDSRDSRADRSLDDRLLGAICDVISPDLTMARLGAALRTVMGEPGVAPELTDEERSRLADDLFSDEYRRQAHGHLRRIESYVHPLRDLGVNRAQPRPEAFVTCLTLDSDARNVRNDLLVDLIVQWATRRLLTGDPPRTLIVAGADDLQLRHVERLSDLCAQRDIKLALLFRHLRDASLRALGGGAVGFMRLGNHEEATRAADFIGRQHKFVLSQLTRTLGGNESHGDTYTDGRSDSESLNVSTTVSRFSNWTRGPGMPIDPGSFGGGHSTARSRGLTWSTSRNWSAAHTWSEGTNWSDATSEQRVYEYAVEPSVLQHLPDHAMLLVESRPGGPKVHAVEVDPAIITLPRASHEPLPEVPAGPAAAGVPGRQRTAGALPAAEAMTASAFLRGRVSQGGSRRRA